MGYVRVLHDMSTIKQKHDAARRADGSGGGIARDGRREMLDAEEEQTGWDEDDVMVFSGETHMLQQNAIAKKKQKKTGREHWSSRSAVNFSLTFRCARSHERVLFLYRNKLNHYLCVCIGLT